MRASLNGSKGSRFVTPSPTSTEYGTIIDMEQSQQIHLSATSVFKAALVLIGLYVVYLLRDLVLVLLTAVVIASAVEPGARWFVRHKVPRIIGVLTIYLGIAIIVSGIFFFMVPPLLQDTSSFLRQIPQYIESIPLLQGVESISEFNPSQSGQAITTLARGMTVSELLDSISQIPAGAFSTLSTVFGGAFSLMLIVVISFYLTVQERGIENFLNIVTPAPHREYAVNLWKRAQRKIGQWMQGQLLLVLIIGVLTYLSLSILGVKHALLFAILAGLMELIPLFGPIIASIPAIIISFVDGGATLALVVAGVYAIIQQFENHLIYPLVVNKVVGVPSLLVILALIIGGQLAGFLGILLAVPIATVLMELTEDFHRREQARQTT